MEVVSSSVKRKRSSSSIPSINILTRSKSLKCINRARSDPISGKTDSFPPESEATEAVLEVNRKNASPVSCVKDLRIRRVPAPNVNSIREQDEEKEENVSKLTELLKDSGSGSYAGGVSESDLESGNGEMNKGEKSGELNGLTFNEGAISKTKMIVKSSQRKIFRNPSSFSYRRLLPYLMDFGNDEFSDFKHEIVDIGVPVKLQKSRGVNSEVWSAKNGNISIVGHDVGHFDNTKSLDKEETQKFDARLHTELPHNQQDSSGLENEMDQKTENVRQLEIERGIRENCNSRDDAKLEEECVQMTPPDPDIFSKMEVGRDGETTESNDMLSNNQINKVSLVDSRRNIDASLKQSVGGNQYANSINKQVLRPCSRLRVFKNPKSVSYRRLLPFLMNMSQNDTSASSIIQQGKPRLDLEEDVHPLESTAEQNNLKTIQTEILNEKRNIEDREMNLLSSVFPPADGSSFDTDSHPGSSVPLPSYTNDSSNVELNSVTSENLPDPCTPLDLQKEETSESQSSPTTIEPQLTHTDINGVVQKVCNSAIPQSSTINDVVTNQCVSEEHGQAMIEEKCLGVVGVHNKNGEVNSNQSSFQGEVSDSVVTSTDVPSFKGILKRNPRGCRGPCNCLNCASFRLHADRAFEFARNQLLDSEEIASGLMTELASLRLMLGKIVANENDLAVIQLNPVQVRQACNKALEVENEAKARLRQLNYDMNIHCRTPDLVQPKVTFASYVQERTVPISTNQSVQKSMDKVNCTL